MSKSKRYVKVAGILVPVVDFPFASEDRSFNKVYVDPKYRGRNRCPTIPGGFAVTEFPTIPRNDLAPNLCPQCGRTIKFTQSLCNLALSGKPCYAVAHEDWV